MERGNGLVDLHPLALVSATPGVGFTPSEISRLGAQPRYSKFSLVLELAILPLQFFTYMRFSLSPSHILAHMMTPGWPLGSAFQQGQGQHFSRCVFCLYQGSTLGFKWLPPWILYFRQASDIAVRAVCAARHVAHWLSNNQYLSVGSYSIQDIVPLCSLFLLGLYEVCIFQTVYCLTLEIILLHVEACVKT